MTGCRKVSIRLPSPIVHRKAGELTSLSVFVVAIRFAETVSRHNRCRCSQSGSKSDYLGWSIMLIRRLIQSAGVPSASSTVAITERVGLSCSKGEVGL
jgi:hypothetical protein